MSLKPQAIFMEIPGMLHHVMSISLLTTLVATAPAASQIKKGASLTQKVVIVPRALVGNPFVTGPESGIAVAVGTRLREHLGQVVSKDAWTITSRTDMNTSLAKWGFPNDAVLSSTLVRTFAVNTGSQLYITSELNKGKDGLWVLTAHFLGMSFAAGHTFTVVQAPNMQPQEMGTRLAEAMVPAFKAFQDAKDCRERISDPKGVDLKKVNESAAKAYKLMPNFGMASMCLAEMESNKDPLSQATVDKLHETLTGDSLAVDVYKQLVKIYVNRVEKSHAKADSTAVVTTYQELLRVAPTDQPLLELAVVVFKQFGKPDAADAVADQILELDPNSLRGLDLRSNSCISKDTKAGYACAMAALERYYLIDSTQADSTFFQKISYAAQSLPDTAKLEYWTAKGLKLNSNDVELLKSQGYARLWRKNLDGAVQNFQMVSMLSSELDGETKSLLKLAVNQYLLNGELDKVVKLFPKLKSIEGQADFAGEVGGMVLQLANSKMQDTVTKDYKGQMAAAEAYLSLKIGNPKFDEAASFFVGVAATNLITGIAAQAEQEKSCERFKEANAMLDKVEKGMTDGKGASPAYAAQVLGIVPGQRAYLTSQITALCKSNH